MDILVGVHVGGDYNPGINAAKISLDDDRIQQILKIGTRVARRPGEIITAYDSTPDLGTSDLDLENNPYLDIAKLSDEDSKQAVFGASPEDGRSELIMLHVDGTDFWWEGVFKHTDVRWETRMIPLSFLPQPTTKSKKVKSILGSLSDLNMTPEQMNAIHENIAKGMTHGLNALEIEQTLNRRVTKVQLIRCLMEIIDRDHN